MIGMGQIQNGVAKHHHQLFMLANKRAGQWPIAGSYNYAFPMPLPELCLGGPKLFAVAADHEGSFLLFLLLRLEFVMFFCTQLLFPHRPQVTPLRA